MTTSANRMVAHTRMGTAILQPPDTQFAEPVDTDI